MENESQHIKMVSLNRQSNKFVVFTSMLALLCGHLKQVLKCFGVAELVSSDFKELSNLRCLALEQT